MSSNQKLSEQYIHLGSRSVPALLGVFEVSPSTLREYTEAIKLFLKKKHSSACDQ